MVWRNPSQINAKDGIRFIFCVLFYYFEYHLFISRIIPHSVAEHPKRHWGAAYKIILGSGNVFHENSNTSQRPEGNESMKLTLTH